MLYTSNVTCFNCIFLFPQLSIIYDAKSQENEEQSVKLFQEFASDSGLDQVICSFFPI